MIDVNDLRKGVIFEYDGSLFRVLEYTHHKPGRGNAIIRVKARNVRTGSTIEKTFQSGDRVQDVRLDYHNLQYLYNDGDLYHFMDPGNYEQIQLAAEILGDVVKYLVPNTQLFVESYDGKPIGVELPPSVELRVVSTEPALRGATVSNVNKPAKLETGLVIQVPPFVNEGELIRVDTNEGKYLERVKS